MANYSKTYLVGVSLCQLKQLLDLPANQQKPEATGNSCLDTTGGNELYLWIQAAKSAFAGTRIAILIKGDNNSKYPMFKNVIEALKKNDVYKYNLITLRKMLLRVRNL